MTNSIALGLGLAILVALGINFWFGFDAHIFLAKQFVDLIQVMAFWR
ncbi:hypothetical protein [Mesobaculum littorinae]|nr:hypothetical protein [Mesobaculum littorinae]